MKITFTPEEAVKLRYRMGLAEYLKWDDWRYLVTLTFRTPVTEQAADAMLDSFLKRLRNRVYGKKSKKKLNVVPFLEKNDYDGLHVHLLVEDASKRSQREEARLLHKTVQYVWETTEGPVGRINVSCPDGASWFKDIDNTDGAVNYCLKQVKRNPDVVRWHLAELPMAVAA